MWWDKKKQQASQAASDRETWRSYAQAYTAHADQIPTLRSDRDILTKLSLAIAGTPGYQRGPDRNMYAATALHALSDLSDGVMRCLEGRAWTAAPILAQSLAEQAVTLQFVLESKGDDRLTALLRQALLAADRRAWDWLQAATQAESEMDMKLAQMRMNALLQLRQRLKLPAAPVDWPDLNARTAAIGQALHYHHLFSGAADNRHGLIEDVGHLISFEHQTEYDPVELYQAWEAEKLSMAVFLAAHALWSYCYVLIHLSQALGDSGGLTQAQAVAERLCGLIAEHDQLDAYHRALPPGSVQGAS